MTEATLIETGYETVIGLEVHVQLNTNTKLFCACTTQFGNEQNNNTCPVCLGMPGVLPVLNKTAVESAILLGLALNCDIAPITKFDRKQYFYPDLPKGYQISQYDYPVALNGYLNILGRRIGITRAHMEEDAGKLVHQGADGLAGATHSLVDLNRAGVPLVEIVSDPDIRTAEEARVYGETIRNIVRYLGVGDGNMEEGSLRADVNISVRKTGTEAFGTKTEIKNMNSFRAIEKAIDYESARQIDVLETGGTITQESRLWNEAKGITESMRSKEDAHDYRYFPDPDLRPLAISADWVEDVKTAMPELPLQRLTRLQSDYGLPEYDANLLVDSKELGDFFLETSTHCSNNKAIANWLMGDITAHLKTEQTTLDDTKLTPEHLAQLIDLLDENTISSAIAKKLLPDVMQGKSPKALVDEQGLAQVSDEGAIEDICQTVINEHPQQAQQVRDGEEKVIGFLVGQVMKASQGKVNPGLANQTLKKLLSS